MLGGINDRARLAADPPRVDEEDPVRILIVDPDPDLLSRASTALEAAHYHVNIALDGPEGLDRAARLLPDVLVLGTRIGDVAGVDLAAAIRAQAGLHTLPVVYVAAGPELAPGAEIAVTRAAAGRALPGAVEQALLDAQLPSGPSDMSGRLDRMSLASVLTLLEIERKCGWLIVRNEVSVSRIVVRSGSVIGARTDPGGDIGAGCVYRALVCSAGTFDFFEGDVLGEAEMDLAIAAILLEGARQLDEAARKTPPPAVQPQVPRRRLSSSTTGPIRHERPMRVYRGRPITRAGSANG